MESCLGCGALFPPQDGVTHAYMASSPACFAAFNQILAAEYSSALLMGVHRFTVDTWAVQHPGDPSDRRAVQSVGLHLARLCLQLACPISPAETNAAMLDFARHKKTLEPLAPPRAFRMTAADVAPFAGTQQHAQKVRTWAQLTWEDWAEHHGYIRAWLSRHCAHWADLQQ